MLHLDYPALAALSAVLGTGSFDRAAAELGVTPSAVSQRIAALEDRLGTVLVIRGKPCTATPAGTRLARHAEEVGLLERALAADLGDTGAGPARIRLAVNADSLATWLVPALSAAGSAYLFDIVVDDQDHSAGWLRRGEVAAAVTADARPVQGCDLMPLGSLRYLATASPAFAARWFPGGPTAAALAAAPALMFDAKDRLERDWAAAAAGRPVALPAHRLPSSTAFVEAALLDLGWGMNPEPLVRDHIAQGRLVALSPRPLDTPLSFQWTRRLAGPLAPLRAAIRQAAARVLLVP
jgi:LysR family transcriptional regulator (chromosome initiation inhibitor)